MMRKTAILGLMLLAGAALATAAAKHSAAGITLTGCLQKGDEPNTFLLTNATGTGVKADRWELVGAPASLKMSDHVGHKVEVHGTSVSEAASEKLEHEKGAKKEKESAAEKAKEKGEHHLHVHSLKHIAPTCP